MPYNWDKSVEIRDDRRPAWFWIEKNVWIDERLTAADKVLYGTLAYFSHGRTQESFPGLHRLATDSCLSRSQTALSIKKLENLQYISITRNFGKVNKYQLLRIPLQDNVEGVQNLDGSKIWTGIPVQNKGVVPVQNTATNNNYINKNNNNNNVIAGKSENKNSLLLEDSNNIADKPQSQKRISIEKQSPLHRIVYFLEDTQGTKIVNWGKQAKALKMMMKAGYTEGQITRAITYMAKKDDFFINKGFDLMTVANNISRYKAQAEKEKKRYG